MAVQEEEKKEILGVQPAEKMSFIHYKRRVFSTLTINISEVLVLRVLMDLSG